MDYFAHELVATPLNRELEGLPRHFVDVWIRLQTLFRNAAVRGQNDRYRRTVPANLQKLLDQSLVEEVNRRDKKDPRRRYYRLTSLGDRVVAAEIQRLEGVFRRVKTHLHSIKPRRA